jgi:ketosteroid isomerase-like protein
MEPKDVVLALYRAHAQGRPEAITALLHPDVAWVAPPANATAVALGLDAGEVGPPDGARPFDRAAIVTFMTEQFPRLFTRPRTELRAVVAAGDVVVVEQRLSATLADGRPYVNDYCFVHEVRDGLVWRIREYMDTRGGWAQVFGDGPPRRLA